ncbi:MAG: A/G-specific adenine glycosylase [Firmicutes bacterium]|nr:A/G-specific adenine glycosylase [Bacillota bacterium]
MKQTELKQTTASITAWYAQHKRDLPWRKGRDPYRIWISEIMLQQTRIEAVIPYYERFLRELPDVKALSEVPDDRLMKLWEGLGYYSRARNLKKAAQTVMEQYGGEMPRTAETLRKLPGIGDYTAGSIASIAFGEPEPAVDGNVMRVMMRLLACKDDIMEQKNRRAVTQMLRDVYPCGEDAALLTEGLMELGERICIPNGMPLCGACPAADSCRAHVEGREQDYPVRSAKKDRRIEEKTVLLLRCNGRYALQKRPAKGLLAGLWGFPMADGHLPEAEVGKQVSDLDPVSITPLGKSKHIFTHIEWHMTGYLVECKKDSPDYLWVLKDEAEAEYSIPTAFKFYKKQLQNL